MENDYPSEWVAFERALAVFRDGVKGRSYMSPSIILGGRPCEQESSADNVVVLAEWRRGG